VEPWLKVLARGVPLVLGVLVWLSYLAPLVIGFRDIPVFCGVGIGLGVAFLPAGLWLTRKAWLAFLLAGLFGWLAEVVVVAVFAAI
jgi:hypothetical protein